LQIIDYEQLVVFNISNKLKLGKDKELFGIKFVPLPRK